MPGHHRGRVGLDLQPANSEFHDVLVIVHGGGQRLDHGGGREQRVLALTQGRRAGMGVLTANRHAKGALALYAGDHADAETFFLQHRPLLDMRLDIGGDRPSERALRHLRKGERHVSEALRDRDPFSIAHRQDVAKRHVAGVDGRAHHARREARALFVHPGDDLDRPHRRLPAVANRLHRLQRRKHTVDAVELAAGGLAVDMRAAQHRCGGRITAFEAQKEIAGGVAVGLEAKVRPPADEFAPRGDFGGGQRLAIDAIGGRRTVPRQEHVPFPEPVADDMVGDRFAHAVFMICCGKARGSRGAQRPASACAMKSATKPLKYAGSSRLSVCPVLGSTNRPQAGIVFFMNRPGCRQWSSSSPTTTSVGTVIFFSRSSRS